jgi:hypothetical protein
MLITYLPTRKAMTMEFYIDIGVAVMLRVLKDRRQREKYVAVFRKVYNAIGRAMVPAHVDWESQSTAELP